MKHLLLLLLLCCCHGYGQDTVTDKDCYAIAQQLIQKLNAPKQDSIYFSVNADNTYVATLFEKHLKDSIFLKQERSMAWIGKKEISQSSIDLLEEVFSKENYLHIKPQIRKSIWKSTRIKSEQIKFISEIERPKYSARNYIYISEPVFTKDKNYALICYGFNGKLALTIFQSVNSNWKEVKFIPLGIM